MDNLGSYTFIRLEERKKTSSKKHLFFSSLFLSYSRISHASIAWKRNFFPSLPISSSTYCVVNNISLKRQREVMLEARKYFSCLRISYPEKNETRDMTKLFQQRALRCVALHFELFSVLLRRRTLSHTRFKWKEETGRGRERERVWRSFAFSFIYLYTFPPPQIPFLAYFSPST